jgi:Zn-dependent protease with chaperone function
MDFFARQEQAHRNTKLLVVYFVLAVVLLIVAVYFAVLLLFVGAKLKADAGFAGPLWWQPQLFCGVAAGTLAVIIIGSVSKTMQLSDGGKAVAEMLGGRLVDPNAADPDERKLLNVVEEMAIASGTPVPQVYVMDDEQAVNAFAAGFSASDAVIGVTHGCTKLLKRDELQGVIGHEFSHILNGDMRLNLRLIGIIFGILCITVIGRVLLRAQSRSSKGRNPLPLLGLALILIGSAGVFFGRLIQAAVSRQREFLADASSVQFTRNPDGLVGALKKIGGLSYGSRLESPHTQEACHMLFGNGLGESFFNLMATHPPLNERIRAIDPTFDGVFPPVTMAPVATAVREAPPPRPQRPIPPPRLGTLLGGAAAVLAAQKVPAGKVLAQVGAPTPDHISYATGVKASLPESLLAAARDPLEACAVIYALLLSADPNARAIQVQQLAQNAGEAMLQKTSQWFGTVSSLDPRLKLPLVDLALPALRRLSRDPYDQLTANLQLLIESDRQVELFEYMVQKMVLRHLNPYFNPVKRPVIQYHSLTALGPDAQVLLSVLARAGNADEEQTQTAFVLGTQQLRLSTADLRLLPASECNLALFERALNRFNQASPAIKKIVLDACAHTIAADGMIQINEAELLRAIADSLGCPVPPFIDLGTVKAAPSTAAG